MPYSKSFQYSITFKEYKDSYTVVLCGAVSELTPGKLRQIILANGEDGWRMKINYNYYSFVLKAYKVFLN